VLARTAILTGVLALAVTGSAADGGRAAPASAQLGVAEQLGVAQLSARATLGSYAPGERVELVVRGQRRELEFRILRAGAERAWSAAGKPMAPPRRLTLMGRSLERIVFRVGDWPSGLYLARLTTRDRKATFAPFIVRAPVAGTTRVAVVMPTYTWQAYNFYDADGDGRGDSWYVDRRRRSVSLTRPFAGDGRPPKWRGQQRGFIRFLTHTGKRVDYLGDEDLDRFASGDELAALYDLVVFSGHAEYVTAQMYDVVQRYRDLGGNLLFLSANNFFWRVDRKGDRIWLVKLWRELGRPEAGLVGVQYRANDRGERLAPYVVRDAAAGAWLFEGLGVSSGSVLGSARYGIEFDMLAPESPPGTAVLAEVDPVFDSGDVRGQMTYYETPAGAKVFAAGTLGFGGSDNPTGKHLFENLWRKLVAP
jgi:hypothetical protein